MTTSRSGDWLGTATGGVHGALGQRANNERQVLTLLRRHGALPKAELARKTGLSAQAISVIIRALEDSQFLLKGEPQRGRIGQPSVPMRLNPEGAFFVGLKVGRRSVEVIVTDFLGQIRDREHKVHTYPDFDDVIAFSCMAAERLQRRLGPDLARRVAGMGIAMPFHLWSWAPHLGVSADKMADWESRDLRAELAARIDLPVHLQNDATSACSAELVFGTTPLPASFLHFYIAFFVGGGLVLNNALFTGTRGNAAGYGPLLVPDLDGTPRPLIDLASLAGLEERLKQAGRDGMMLWNSADSWDIPESILAPWVTQTAHGLARACHATMAILDLDAVFVDGWMPGVLRARLTEETRQAFDKLDRTGMYRPEIREGSIGADARVLGAASLPLSAH